MTTWLSYIIGACCIIWALLQTRTTLVYLGVLKSAVIPEYQTSPIALIHSAMQDVISFLVYGILFFTFSWPKIVTYIVTALLLKAILNLFLVFLGIGHYGIIELTNKGKARQALSETVSVVIYFIAATASVYFFGW
jgi:hypothetical protein